MSYRPPIGMPLRRERESRAAGILSAVFHALIIALLIFPFFQPSLGDASTGGGGPGPAGGGGGGTGGTGGEQAERMDERLRYIEVIPDPIPTPDALPPIEEKPEEVEETPKIELNLEPVQLNKPVDMALTAGVGGGTGRDGTTGTGPGSGGGVGSGIGTGRGSSVGPGTGGGDGEIFPPDPIHLFLPPMPWPEQLRGHTLVAKFDVDSTGKVLAVSFNPTKDVSYNRRLRAALESIRFRPGMRRDGTPVRAIGKVEYIF